MEYSVNLNIFQGPFDLLFHLIENKEIDIYDIPIFEITEQYMEYLDQMRQYSMGVTSEFILMAATLIEIKSQMLLPQKSKEEDPRLELVNKLLEYKMFKNITTQLKEYEIQSSLYFSKPKEEVDIMQDAKMEQIVMDQMNIYELYNIFAKLMKSQNVKVEDTESYKIYRENYSVKQCSDDLIKNIKSSGFVSLFDLFQNCTKITKEYVVTMFLATLEISKIQGMKITQDEIFSDIFISYAQEGEQFA